jgi:hypothetical protein
MIATFGFFARYVGWSVRCGSLRWYDPDRFDGFDLSRVSLAAPLADGVIMGILAPFGKVLSIIPKSGCRFSDQIMLHQ